MEAMLTVAEVAQLYQLNRDTIRRLIRKGSLPAVKFGNTYRITQADARTLATPKAAPPVPRNERARIAKMLRAS